MSNLQLQPHFTAAIFNVAAAFAALQLVAFAAFAAATYCDKWTPASVRARVYKIL